VVTKKYLTTSTKAGAASKPAAAKEAAKKKATTRVAPAKRAPATKKAAAKPVAPAKTAKAAPGANKSVMPKLLDIFAGAGFTHVVADGFHIDFMGRMGEIDHIFVWQNVVLLCEETTEKSATKHCTNKIHFHRQIAGNWQRLLAPMQK
jgi:hypothetical protein